MSSSTIQVLSWNIFMMPSFAGIDLISPGNEVRSEMIGKILQHEEADIICFQKAFDEKARNNIHDKLVKKYPFSIGPVNPTDKLGHTNSGLWILSNQKLSVLGTIDFSEAKGWEKLSRKGAIIVTGTAGGKTFQLVNTHLQGDGDPAAGKDYTDTRLDQLKEIREKILQPNITPRVPQIICGDMSISRFEQGNAESAAYLKMLHLMDAENGKEKRITLCDDQEVNDLARYNTGHKREEDYILLRNADQLSISRAVKKIKGEWQVWPAKKHNDLSYRYAVSSQIHL